LLAVEDEGPGIMHDVLDRGLPHLTRAEQDAVRSRYLGQVTWSRLCRAVGIDPDSLPEEQWLTRGVIDQYAATEVTVLAPHGEWLGARDARTLGSEPMFVITAWNPGAHRPSPAENCRRNEDLYRRLIDIAHVWPARGASPDGSHVEESFALSGISLAAALELAREFGQAGIFELATDRLIVHGCDGSWERRRQL
jgi:hypothetical protein